MALATYNKKKRGIEQRKRKRLVFVSAEGKNKSETLYLKSFNNKDIYFKFVSGNSTDPIKMSKDLIGKMKEEGFNIKNGDLAYCIIDGDFDVNKNNQIKEADLLSNKNNFKVILSNPCFEIWYLCYFIYSTKLFTSNEEVINKLREYVPDYRKNVSNMRTRLIDRENVAINNAKRLEEYNLKIGKRKHTIEFSPCSEMYTIIEDLANL
jgi:hypothetical protein